jgi:hypothetical protein
MTTTNLKFNNYDLGQLFSSNIGNSTYTGYYSSLSNIDTYSGNENTLLGTNNVGFSINGTDIVSIFHPIYYDRDENAVTSVIDIPEWCNKIGFVLQSSGGRGGPSFNNYWQKINIPTTNQVQSYYAYNWSTQTHWQHWNRYNYRRKSKCHIETNEYGREYHQNIHANYNTNYSRNIVESASYYGSGGGGGGCCGCIYTIDPNNRINSMVHTVSDDLGYCQLYFEDGEFATTYTGNDAVENSYVTTQQSPEYMSNSNTDNTSTDTRGTGGSFLITSNTNKLTTQYGSNGSNGEQTDGAEICSGGSSGISNSNEILSHFMPSFNLDKGVGATGSTNSSFTSNNNNYLRYWFIR